MKQREKWLKTFYKNHQGVHHFDPTFEMGWKGALEMVLKIKKDGKILAYYNDDILMAIEGEIRRELEE